MNINNLILTKYKKQMKKAGLILAACLLIASCSVNRHNTIDVNEFTFDTLRVNVIIFDGDTLTGIVSYD